jgi:hypothetical protein
MNKANELEKSIKEFDIKYDRKRSNMLFILEDITQEHIEFHSKMYLKLEVGEKPLLMLNGKPKISASLTALHKRTFSGFLITNKKIHFTSFKRSYFSSVLLFREKPNSFTLETVDSFQMGERDNCFGNNYFGHDLIINNMAQGLVFCEDKALEYINSLSNYLFQNGFLKTEIKEYSWQ